MAIRNELQTFHDIAAAVLPGFTVRKQQTIKVSAAKVCTIKRMESEIGRTLTNSTHQNEYTYRFVIYDTSELSVMDFAEQVGNLFAKTPKIPVSKELAWLSLSSFSFSESFETETAGVFAVIGMVRALKNEVKTKKEKTMLQHVHLRFSEALADAGGD